MNKNKAIGQTNWVFKKKQNEMWERSYKTLPWFVKQITKTTKLVYVLYPRFTGLWRVCTLPSPFFLVGLCHPFLLLPALLIFPEASQMPLLLFSLPCFPASFEQLTAINALKMFPVTPLHKHLFIYPFLPWSHIFIKQPQVYKYINMGGGKC